MRHVTQKQIEWLLKGTIVCALLVLIALCILLVRQYRHLRRVEFVTAHGSVLSALHARGPLDANSANLVASWMTFDYINHLFALPPQYLQKTLDITDSRYPHLALSEYADDAHLGQATFLAHVQNAVEAFFAPQQ
jgi:hypothetical protein